MEYTDQQLETALRNADKSGNESDARAIAQELQKRRQSAQSGGFAAFANKSLVNLLGAPVDITNSILDAIGVPVSEKPFGGSESIASAAKAIGLDIPEREPETFPETLGQVGGEVAGFTLPMAKAAQVLSKGTGTTSRVSRAMIEEMIERPARAAAAESAGVVGISAAREVAKENELSPTAQVTLETIGGLIPSLAISSTTRVPKTVAKLGYKALIPFLPSGAMSRASRRIQELALDPEKAAQKIDELKGTGLSPSARTEDPALMSLEQTVLKETPAEMTKVSIKRSEVMNKLANTIRRSGNIKDARRFVQAKVNRLKDSLSLRIEKAADEAAQSLESLGTPDASSASVAVRNSLEKALADARVQEDQLWGAIDKTVKGPIKNVINKYKELDAGLASSQKSDMPASAKRAIGPSVRKKTGKGTRARVRRTNVQELYGLYRKLGEEATAARAAGEFNKARIANDLRESILRDLDNFSASGEVADSIDAARQFSAELNSKFTKGPVGKILRFAREGIEATPEELTLQATIKQGGVPAKLAARAIEKAADDATVMEGISDFLKSQFIRDGIDANTGRVKPGSADSFLKKYKEVLDLVPATRDQIRAAKNSEDVLRRVIKRSDAMRSNLDRPSVSIASRLLRAPAGKEIAKIMQSPEPLETMKVIVNTAKKDKSGQSIQGLRAAMAEYLIDNVTSPSMLDVRGTPVLNGVKLRNMLFEDNLVGPMRLLFSGKELTEIKSAAKQMSSIQKLSKTKSQEAVISDRPGWILEKMSQIFGAKIGAKMSSTAGGSIQSANIGSNAARNFLNSIVADKAKQLLIDAVQDPELMKALLTHRSAQISKNQEKVIRNYMLSPVGSRLVDEATLEQARAEDKKEKISKAQSIDISR
jgi:hypothetical protein